MKILVIGISAAALLCSSSGWSQQQTSKGTVLVDRNKMTLYTFDKDPAGKSTCNGACATNWPPYTDQIESPKPSAAMPGDWSVITRDDGTKMWGYKGKPVYYFKDDKAPGDVKGDGVNGVWHVVKFP
jgi:predicted lipoprotein with Yx(FWY)xxD motif